MMMGDQREIEGGPAHEHLDGNSMMMRMYFHFGLGDQLLFRSLIVDSNYKLLAACLVLCLASILNEAIRHWRTIKCNCELPFIGASKLSDHDHDHDDNAAVAAAVHYCCAGSNYTGYQQDNDSASYDAYRSPRIQQQPRYRHCEHRLLRQETQLFRLAQVILHTIGYSLSLTLMLVVMSFNVCLIFSIVFGEFRFYSALDRTRVHSFNPRVRKTNSIIYDATIRAGSAIGTYLFFRPSSSDMAGIEKNHCH